LPEGLGAVAQSARRHAALNENAVRRTPFTMDEYFASRMVASPLRLFDCSTMVDGAGAVVVTSKARAADLPNRPVDVKGFAARTGHRTLSQFTDFESLELKDVARRALGRAGIELRDLDVAMIHDAFTISVIVYLEEMGFCGRGEGSAYALEGNLDLGSACPVNTHGGLLSQGHVAGFLHVTEAVRQLRGTAGAAQVQDAQHAMVAGNGGIFGVNTVMVLGQGG
jgi:acetyl-CoA acetyltransferase